MMQHIIHISLTLAVIANIVSLYHINRILETHSQIHDLLMSISTGISTEKLRELLNGDRVQGVAEDTKVAE